MFSYEPFQLATNDTAWIIRLGSNLKDLVLETMELETAGERGKQTLPPWRYFIKHI